MRPSLMPVSCPQFLDEPLGAAAGWTCRQVGQWLESLNLEQYVEEFSAHGVDGPRLLHLDGAKLKVGGAGGDNLCPWVGACWGAGGSRCPHGLRHRAKRV